jgi:hypothetical protein
MSPQEAQAATDHANAMAASAQKVMALDGSPSQKLVYQSELNKLVQNGSLDQPTADALAAKGPDRAILQLAVTAPEWIKSYGGGGYAKMLAEVKNLESQTGKNNAEGDLATAHAGYFTNMTPARAAQQKAAADKTAAQTKILQSDRPDVFGTPPAAAPAPTPDANGQTTAQPVPAAKAAMPATQADFDALPSGALYVNPSDGQTYKKK